MALLNEKRKTYQADLRDNLGRRKDELQSKLVDLEELSIGSEESKGLSTHKKKAGLKQRVVEMQSKDLEVIDLDLHYLERFLDDLNLQIGEIDQRVQQLKKVLSEKETLIDNLRKDETLLEDSVAEGLKQQDNFLNKRNLLYETVEHKRILIRELGSLPRRELDEYQGYSETRLLSTLKEVNEQLKAFSGDFFQDLSLLK